MEDLDSTQKTQIQAEYFSNRLAKKYKLLRKWARKNRVSCYRVYDRDIPEVPLSADIYEFLPENISDKNECAAWLRETGARISANDQAALSESKERTYLHLFLYERPYEKDPREEERWMDAMACSAAKVLQIPRGHIIQKLRKRQKGESQYEKTEAEHGVEGITQECGQLFKINLTKYLDTGLFLDHRPLRNILRQSAAGKSVLNLFCYTGSFSVYAAEGKAARIESVDMSNTYLDWARENMLLNGFSDRGKYIYTRQDALGFLNQKNAEVMNKDGTNRFDIIILDPPTFSNSKNTQSVLDINRDWSALCAKCAKILKPGGTLYFSTNSRRLSLKEEELKDQTPGLALRVQDITKETIPDDFREKRPHRCWKITLA